MASVTVPPVVRDQIARELERQKVEKAARDERRGLLALAAAAAAVAVAVWRKGR